MQGCPPVQVYTCSSVETDYFKFLNYCLEAQGMRVSSIWYLREHDYRFAARKRGLAKAKLRLQMYVFYPFKLCIRAFQSSSSSIFIVTTNTFYAPLLAAIIGRLRGFQTIQLLYDLFPDALEVSGALKPGSLLTRFLGKIAHWTQQLCSGCIYLGEFLRFHAEARWGRSKRGMTIDIGGNTEAFEGHDPFPHDVAIVFHYGGQLGYMHDAKALAVCIQNVLESEIIEQTQLRFHFYTSGAQVAFLKKDLSNYPVEIADAVPSSEWREKIRGFQVGLVSLSPGGATVCLPSKTYAMMAGGMAILAICPLWSDLARLVLENDAGWVVNNSPYSSAEELIGSEYMQKVTARRSDGEIAKDFTEIVDTICRDTSLLWQKRKNARRAAIEKYGSAGIAEQWAIFLQNKALQPEAEQSVVLR